MTRLARWFALAAAGLFAAATVPRWVAAREAGGLFRGEVASQEPLANAVAAYLDGPSQAIVLGDERFEGEWALVSYQMTILGLGQVVLEHPELRDRYVPYMERAAVQMMRPAQRAFATRAWGSDGLAALGGGRGDAWLGWPALALSMLRVVHPETPFAADDDRIVDAIARRLAASRHGLIETYPGQSFPADVAACAAAIALRADAVGAPRPAWMTGWLETYRARWIDRASGFLWQQGDWLNGKPRDAPRGSGTAVAAYFLSFVDLDTTATLTDALAAKEKSLLGFGAIPEFAPGHVGQGDGDSGPVVLGVSIAATGFALGAARAAGRESLFVDLYRTTDLFGVPVAHGDGVRFATGGPFGNAVMLALLTARGRR